MILHVRRPTPRIIDVWVPDHASSTLACAVIAWACGLNGVISPRPEPWRLVYAMRNHGDHEDPEYLGLDQTVDDIPDPSRPVWLMALGMEAKWN